MPRGVLAGLARLWLVWQLSATAAVPLALWVFEQRDVLACQCFHGVGTTCPMHKAAQGRNQCALRNPTPDQASALLSLLGPVGLAPSPSVSYLTPVSFPLDSEFNGSIDRPVDPDPPPPRA
jgi:hypothetical protein